MRRLIIWSFAIAMMVNLGCDRPTPDRGVVEEVPEGASDEAPIVDDDEADVEDPRQQQAMGAVFDLRDTLMGRVMSVATEEGFAEAVGVCRDEAMPLTEEVADRHGVELGRTSERLRNPENTAPEWFADLALRAQEGPVFEEGPGGELRGAVPIRLAAACTNCHGADDELATGVAAALEADYPQDQATGYEEGDLRGYFWVEVP